MTMNVIQALFWATEIWWIISIIQTVVTRRKLLYTAGKLLEEKRAAGVLGIVIYNRVSFFKHLWWNFTFRKPLDLYLNQLEDESPVMKSLAIVQYIGQQYNNDILTKLKEQYDDIRIVRPEGLLTADYVSSRLNIELDESGKIISFSFG